ncbi:MAG: acetyl-CoA carboxylase biotin carboxylase subunit, partial [Deltaproteobacteria bacterium]
MFEKVLVANRGEIAVRVIRALRELGVSSVAVHSEADAGALHVQLADEAVSIGPPPPRESYLAIETILEAARKTGAEAIHPGYGFLAENADFAQACHDAGITFIGPSPDAIRLMGNKVEARQTLQAAGIPLVPGTEGKAHDVAAITAEAEKMRYPLLVKAAAGGGGKGMRIVARPEELERAITAAMREAEAAFGDRSVYVERYIENPRHIEFQILADAHGHTIHLFERECSIQRRHQKIVEETPSTALTPELRERMGAAAVAVARAVGYVNAGTVEFLLDPEGTFYFLEMNTRIQVEHPITEMTTGVDLVAWQIRIAAGGALTLRQEDLAQRGHAIECRIYAEDPEKGFLPAPGPILALHEPAGPGVRNDSGIYAGDRVTGFYDPILAKLIVWGADREAARQRMILALRDYVILGIPTTIGFLADLL